MHGCFIGIGMGVGGGAGGTAGTVILPVPTDNGAWWWTMAQAPGTTTINSLFAAAAPLTNGAGGAAMVFNNNSAALAGAQYADGGIDSVAGVDLFCGVNPFTVSVVARHTDTGTGTMLARCQATAGNRTFQLFFNGDDSVRLILRGAAAVILYTTLTGVWHHYTCRWDGTTFTFFVDGVSVTTAVPGVAANETNEHIVVGARTGGTGVFLVGNVAEVIAWSAALSDAQILALQATLRARLAPRSISIP